MNDCVPAAIRTAMSSVEARRYLPRLEDIPIPLNCRIDRRWPLLMEEMADHIGPYATVQIAEAFGGQYLYIPASVECSPFTHIIGAQLAKVMAHVFARERVPISPMRDAIRHIRMCQLVRLVRAGRLKTGQAATIARIAIRHMSTLVNSDEYVDDYPLIDLPEPREVALLRAAGDIVGRALKDINLPDVVIQEMRDRMMALVNQGGGDQLNGTQSQPLEIDMLRL